MIKKNKLAVGVYNVIKKYRKCYSEEQEIIKKKKLLSEKQELPIEEKVFVLFYGLSDEWFLEDKLFCLIRKNKKECIEQLENILSEKESLDELQKIIDYSYSVMNPLMKMQNKVIFYYDRKLKRTCEKMVETEYVNKNNKYWKIHRLLRDIQNKLYLYQNENFN